jgi:hypothetical protein
MGERMAKAESRKPNTIRVSLVQLHYNPNLWPDGKPFSEPAFKYSSPRKTNFVLSDLCLEDGTSNKLIGKLMSQLEEEYHDWIQNRLDVILNYLDNNQVDIIIFPEYSLPNTNKILNKLQDFSKDRVIFGGSEIYKSDGKKNIARTIAFIDGERVYQEKLLPSPLEDELIEPGNSLTWKVQDFHESKLLFYLCSDFLGCSKKNSKVMKAEIKALEDKHIEFDDIDLVLVSSLSPNNEIFQKAASGPELATHVPTVFCNTAQYGGSYFHCKLKEPGPRDEIFRTEKIPEGEESIQIVDIDTSHQFDSKPTSLYKLNRTESLKKVLIDSTEVINDNVTIAPYSKFYKNRLLRTIRLLNSIRGCANPKDDDKISKAIIDFKRLFKTINGADQRVNTPFDETYVAIIETLDNITIIDIALNIIDKMYDEDITKTLIAKTLKSKNTLSPQVILKDMAFKTIDKASYKRIINEAD